MSIFRTIVKGIVATKVVSFIASKISETSKTPNKKTKKRKTKGVA